MSEYEKSLDKERQIRLETFSNRFEDEVQLMGLSSQDENMAFLLDPRIMDLGEFSGERSYEDLADDEKLVMHGAIYRGLGLEPQDLEQHYRRMYRPWVDESTIVLVYESPDPELKGVGLHIIHDNMDGDVRWAVGRIDATQLD